MRNHGGVQHYRGRHRASYKVKLDHSCGCDPGKYCRYCYPGPEGRALRRIERDGFKLHRNSNPIKWFNFAMKWDVPLSSNSVRKLRSLMPYQDIYPDSIPLQQFEERWPQHEAAAQLLRAARIIDQPVSLLLIPFNRDCPGHDPEEDGFDSHCELGNAHGCGAVAIRSYEWIHIDLNYVHY